MDNLGGGDAGHESARVAAFTKGSGTRSRVRHPMINLVLEDELG